MALRQDPRPRKRLAGSEYSALLQPGIRQAGGRTFQDDGLRQAWRNRQTAERHADRRRRAYSAHTSWQRLLAFADTRRRSHECLGFGTLERRGLVPQKVTRKCAVAPDGGPRSFCETLTVWRLFDVYLYAPAACLCRTDAARHQLRHIRPARSGAK
ncbi:hypothetical protein AGR4A_Lc60232 [Agrobacterium tumefaciens str. B6]|uniref:Uncharacterized protein n=1 Tax=Agrobacterium tumefaciens str. B6 TaxID=1183423 RepID=A0A822VAH8_AGRTU|nr:hypothetical protein AGR4A_Lc60232 [Agrobacterium tumefaciens str. B6]